MTKRRSRAALTAVLVAVPLLAGPAVASVPAPAPRAVTAPSTALVPGGVSPLSWAGQLWLPRTSAGPEKAGDNYWSPRPDNIFVDTGGRLHLKIVHVAGKWWSSQLTSVRHDFGYGTYRWVVDTPLGRLDPVAVLGMYTYNPVASNFPAPNQAQTGHNEADFELTKFGRASNNFNVQTTVQPYFAQNHVRRFLISRTQSTYMCQFTWARTYTSFVIRAGAGTTGRVLASWKAPLAIGSSRPGTAVNVNLWDYYRAPDSGREQEAVIRSFTYVPAA